MLNRVSTWITAHRGPFDAHAQVTCMRDLEVTPETDTMFRACWCMVLDRARLSEIDGTDYTGTAFGAIAEVAQAVAVKATAWPDRDSHVIAYRQHMGVLRRAASAVRHDKRAVYMYLQPIPVDTRAFERANYCRFA